jgi:SAM-dependent methyltransferase
MSTPKELLGHISAGKVLDVATGNGNFVKFLLENIRDWDEIIGIDTSEKAAIAFAGAFQDKPNIRCVKMDAARMDFPDASFDTVCISNSLHHMPDLESVLAEMMRVLRPRGHFILSEMYCDNQAETQMTHVLLHHWWAEVDTAMGITHNQTFTRRQVLDIIDGLGLADIVFDDARDLGDDPKDPETFKYLSDVLDQYLKRIDGLPEESRLRHRGVELRQRLEKIGFHSATGLLAVGKKP